MCALRAQFALDGRVPVIFDGVVGAIGEQLGDERPFVAVPT